MVQRRWCKEADVTYRFDLPDTGVHRIRRDSDSQPAELQGMEERYI